MAKQNKKFKKLPLFKLPFGQWRIRVWWSELWIRKQEFHRTLNMDVLALGKMTENEKANYYDYLFRRRDIAHQRDLNYNV